MAPGPDAGPARRVRDGVALGWRRASSGISALLQATAAAIAAWLFARYVLDHPEPFFAPVAAVIALNTTLGERGLNAVRFLQGVVVGIATGEVCLALLGPGSGSLALATFVAMALALALGGARITIAQAAVGAILTIAVGDPEAGFDRMIDALVGAGVALIFSQALFSPEPVGLLRRAEAAALRGMADGLRLTASALERDDDELGERAIDELRALRDRLAELGRMRQASQRVARRSLAWRSRAAPVVRENENAGHLDLLGVSCLNLTRTALALPAAERRRTAPSVAGFAEAMEKLARDPGDRSARQAAADRALAVARPLADRPSHPLEAAALAVRAVAADLMMFAGVEPGQAVEAVEEGTGELEVATPPPSTRAPFAGE